VARFRSSPELAASVMLKEVSNPSSSVLRRSTPEGNVVALVEKPKQPRSNLALVGIYLFRSTIFDAIAQIKPSARGELEITDAISKLIELGGRVRFDRVTTWWLDTGKKTIFCRNDTVLDDWLSHAVDGDVDARAGRRAGPCREGRPSCARPSADRSSSVPGLGSGRAHRSVHEHRKRT